MTAIVQYTGEELYLYSYCYDIRNVLVDFARRNDRLIREFNEPGKHLYVTFNTGSRNGSRARVVKINTRPANEGRWSYYVSKGSGIGIYDNIETVTVEWDGRKGQTELDMARLRYTTIEVHSSDIGTEWKFTKAAPGTVTVPDIFDQMGEQINVGDFVAYVAGGYRQGHIRFGVVSKITKAGCVYFNPLKIKATDSTHEQKTVDVSSLVRVDKDLMSRLTLAKLTVS